MLESAVVLLAVVVDLAQTEVRLLAHVLGALGVLQHSLQQRRVFVVRVRVALLLGQLAVGVTPIRVQFDATQENPARLVEIAVGRPDRADAVHGRHEVGDQFQRALEIVLGLHIAAHHHVAGADSGVDLVGLRYAAGQGLLVLADGLGILRQTPQCLGQVEIAVSEVGLELGQAGEAPGCNLVLFPNHGQLAHLGVGLRHARSEGYDLRQALARFLILALGPLHAAQEIQGVGLLRVLGQNAAKLWNIERPA